MENFVFQSPTKIIFGKETEQKVGSEAAAYGSKVLLHYGGGSIKKSGLYDRVIDSLRQANVEWVELSGVQPNPRLSLVRQGITLCREENVDCILAVGGGSVIDSAKSIAVGVSHEGDVWDFFVGKAKITKALPIGVVLTIPAAGSEASKNAVITNEEGWFKRGLASELVRPKFAIMNPELTFTLPSFHTAAGAADIMAHVLERYFTNTKHVDFTDRLCEATLKTMIFNTPIVLREPENYAARAEIMWASTLAHNGILGTGRLEDWATHGIEHELSAIYDVAHGAGLSVMFPAWMKYVYRHNLERFCQFAVRVWGIDYTPDDLESVALAGINRLTEFFTSIQLPVTLKELGTPTDRLEEMADKATANGSRSVGNFVKLSKEDIVEIYNLAK